MIPAVNSKRFGSKTKLLTISSQNSVRHEEVGQLIEYLQAGDLLVVNRSATLPASFHGRLARTGEEFEIRLAAFQGPSVKDISRWLAFAFGAGDWRMKTEARVASPQLFAGDIFKINDLLSMRIETVTRERLLQVQFLVEASLFSSSSKRASKQASRSTAPILRSGRPIQYSYLKTALNNWDQQTLFAGPPVSVEPPSASFPFTWALVESLMKKGIEFGSLLHSAGISSTGDVGLDALLPLPEWFEIPKATVEKFKRAKRSGRDVIAVGTSVLRAMESSWDGTSISAGTGVTSLKIQPGTKIQSATGIITGMHDLGASHMNILDSFCSAPLIRKAYLEAEKNGYRGHEYGDIAFLNCQANES